MLRKEAGIAHGANVTTTDKERKNVTMRGLALFLVLEPSRVVCRGGGRRQCSLSRGRWRISFDTLPRGETTRPRPLDAPRYTVSMMSIICAARSRSIRAHLASVRTAGKGSPPACPRSATRSCCCYRCRDPVIGRCGTCSAFFFCSSRLARRVPASHDHDVLVAVKEPARTDEQEGQRRGCPPRDPSCARAGSHGRARVVQLVHLRVCKTVSVRGGSPSQRQSATLLKSGTAVMSTVSAGGFPSATTRSGQAGKGTHR